MRFVKIFLLFFQDVLYNKAESVVYFLMAFINPIAGFLFWHGAYNDSLLASQGWSRPEILSYYLLLIVAGAMLLAHVEWDVAFEDIQQGNLVNYLTKPFPYFSYKLFSEVPWRLIQGLFGVIFILMYIFLLNGEFSFVTEPLAIIAVISTAISGFLLSFFYKMIVGLSAFWTTDISGIQQTSEVIIIVFSGFVMPLFLYPEAVRVFITYQPFAYILYYPLLVAIGQVPLQDVPSVLFYQWLYIVLFASIAFLLWKKGIRLFTGVGN